MKWLAGLAIVAVLLIGTWIYLFPTYSHRYKMTVEIEVDGRVHRGSGIVDVKFYTNGPLAPLANGTLYYDGSSGRAALIDLGKRGAVLALINPGVLVYMYPEPKPVSGSDIALNAYYGKNEWRSSWRQKFTSVSSEHGVQVLKLDNYPGFIWISNLSAQQSAVPLPPTQMAEIMGISARLRSVTVEITNESPSDEIFNTLPWLATLQSQERDHGVLANANVYRITANQILGDF